MEGEREMRKLFIVSAAVSFGLALLLSVSGLSYILFPDPIHIARGGWQSARPGVPADEATILKYIGGIIQGVDLTCVGIVCAIIGNTSVKLAIAPKRP
jgi:hypothetical protein